MLALKFDDGIFRLFLAEFGSAYGDKQILFRVRIDRIPAERAKEKGIVGYNRLYDVTGNENYVDKYCSYKKFSYYYIEVPEQEKKQVNFNSVDEVIGMIRNSLINKRKQSAK